MENPTTIAVDLSKSVFGIAVERNRRLSAHPRANAEAKSPAAYPPTMMLCTGENIGVGG